MTLHDIDATERILGRLLTAGTLLSTLTLGVGLVLTVLGGRMVGLSLLHGGLIVLLATPVARVALSIVTFASQRDWRFVAFTTIVLLLLITGLLVAVDA